MSGEVVVREVKSWWDRRRFQRLPWKIYTGADGVRDPNWVPPILFQERELLGWGRHPFYDSARAVTLLAERDGVPVGRLAVLVNDIHNRRYNDKIGFFGFFECVNDTAVARALFDAGGQWLRARGMTAVRGPVNPSLNYTCGLLVDSFDRPPCFMMTYNPPYYAPLLEACGFAKSQDLYAYEMGTEVLSSITNRYRAAVQAALNRPDLKLRELNPAKFQEEVETYLNIYNHSLEETWGFTPLQPREAKQIASELKHLLVPQFAKFVEVDGKPIGGMMSLLDYNQIIRKLNGRIFPFGFLKILMGRRKIKSVRTLALTMSPAYHGAGLGVVLINSQVAAAEKWGITRYEFSWILESNIRARGSLERAGVNMSKTYRLYDKTL